MNIYKGGFVVGIKEYNPEDILTWGKYKGKRISEVYSISPKYIYWLNSDGKYYVNLDKLKKYYLDNAPDELKDINFSDFD